MVNLKIQKFKTKKNKFKSTKNKTIKTSVNRYDKYTNYINEIINTKLIHIK